jgi:methionyl-tRNA formyltransferase
LNIHASLLPRWRGAAPIHRAIEAGDATSGVTIMQMDIGLDTGDMLLRDELPILNTDTTGSLHDKLAVMGGDLIVKALASVADLKAVKQPEVGITYAHKIEKTEAQIDWSQNAEVITRRIRAFNPFPGAVTTLNGEQIKVWGAEVGDNNLLEADKTYKNGQILAVASIFTACAAMNSVVNLTELQRPGGKRLKAADFVRGFDVQVGMCFGDDV